MAERVLTEALISSESANNLTDAGERLFGRILAAATTDNWGRRRAEPGTLRADLIPRLPWTDDKLLDALTELVQQAMVVLYSANGRWYLAVTNWDRYQRRIVALRKRQGQSRHPPPPDGAPSVLGRYTEAFLLSRAHARAAEEGPSGCQPTAAERDTAVLSSSTARSASQSPPSDDWTLADGLDRFRLIARELAGASDRTPLALATAARGLPEAAIHTALESLGRRRRRRPPLESEARYVVGALTKMREEGQYR